MKKITKPIFCLLIIISLIFNGCSTQNDSKLKDGVYTAESKGFQSMNVSITIENERITNIEVEHNETDNIGVIAVEQLPGQIVELQGLGVDVIGGATLTSNGILDGVVSCLKEAGATDEKIAELKAIKPEVKELENLDLSADVVVIGAGGAGMAAAVTAHQEGKSVIVIEKTSQMGGNTTLAGGALNAVDDNSETALANKDSVDFHYEQTFNGGDKQGNPVLVRKLVDEAWDGVEWLMDLGMEFKPGTFTVTGGLWQRAHQPVEPKGSGFFKTYAKYIESNDGITMVYNTAAEEFIVENDVVTGVVAKGNSGNKVTVKANNGVVLATGGFGQNIKMRVDYSADSEKWPVLDESYPSTNTSAITGDGMIMAQKIGANLIQMENIQLLPTGDPESGSLSGSIGNTVESRIYINKDGNRYVDEGGRRDDMTLALIAQEDHLMYVLCDSDSYPTGDEKNNFGETLNSLVDQGRTIRANTLEELAELIDIPAENLIKTVDEYNRHCLGGDLENQKDEFGRSLFIDSDKIQDGINEAPFYVSPRVPTVHHTMGGVEINEFTEVINEDGEVISGLYAAGEVTGGIHGTNRLGGNALTDTIVFGRTAGKQASQFVK